MDREYLEERNARTLARLKAGAARASEDAYFGFYTVDIFECPPFLMFTANDCHRAADILYQREFEPMSMKVWCGLVPVATGICDIGAQVGVYSLAAAALRSDLPIHAFEPNPYAYTRLRLHKQVNGFDQIVEHPLAVGEEEIFTMISWLNKPGKPISSGAYIGTTTRTDVETVPAQVKPLTAMISAGELGSRGLMKIDVEGAEEVVFRGMGNLIQQRPDIILETFAKSACDAINDVVLPLGYRVYHIREKERQLERQDRLYPQDTAKGSFNQFLTRRSEDELSALLAL